MYYHTISYHIIISKCFEWGWRCRGECSIVFLFSFAFFYSIANILIICSAADHLVFWQLSIICLFVVRDSFCFAFCGGFLDNLEKKCDFFNEWNDFRRDFNFVFLSEWEVQLLFPKQKQNIFICHSINENEYNTSLTLSKFHVNSNCNFIRMSPSFE